MSTDTLDEGRDLTALARAGTLAEPLCRTAEAEGVLELLARGSVLVTGASGAGKTSVIHAAAHALARRWGTRLVEWSCTQMMSGTRYLGEWQSRVSDLASEAVEAQAVLYVTDVLNLATEGTTVHSTSSLLDALRPFVSSGRLRLLAEASAEQLFRMQQVPGFLSLFSELPVRALADSDADAIVRKAAREEGFAESAFAALRDMTVRFLPARPRPGPELALLSRVLSYASEKRAVGEPPTLDGAFVEHVFSIYSGLPKFVVSASEPMHARDIRSWFRQHIVGQDDAVEAVVESIALYKAALHDPQRPIGTFLFVGPTGVGKTEVARSLARFMFGSDTRLLRFDMSEFKDYHAFEMLLGGARDSARPARLLDPVRAQPFQVVLLDEIEKAHPNVYDLLLQLLDEGRLTTPSGDTVSFRNAFFIVTSNVGQSRDDRGVGFDREPSSVASTRDVRRALEQEFRPELLNRFQHIVTFAPLTREQVQAIARKELQTILSREGITRRNLLVEVSDEALELVLERGYDPRYGARALKRELQRAIVLPLAMMLMERPVEAGTLLRVTTQHGAIRVRAVDTEGSRAARAERAPVKLDDHRKLTRPELALEAEQLAARVKELSARLDVPALVGLRDSLLEARADPDLHRRREEAGRVLRDLDRVSRVIGRVERLEDRAQQLVSDLGSATLRSDLERAGAVAQGLSRDLESAARELISMGRDGDWDAVVAVRPLGSAGRAARDLLLEVYRSWAAHRAAATEYLHEPRSDDEPVLMVVSGAFAHGYLRLESGLHRLRDGEHTSVARVLVWPWLDERTTVPYGEHAALKMGGQLGGRIRSRLVCGGLVLQNARTLTENRNLAAEHYASFLRAPAPTDEIIRRYDRSPPLVRDACIDLTSGRWEVLKGAGFHELLCRRLDSQANTVAPTSQEDV